MLVLDRRDAHVARPRVESPGHPTGFSLTNVNTVNWERLWRMSGINFVVFFIVACLIYGNQPKLGASADKLVSFCDGDRTPIPIATVIFGVGVLNLLWFAAAITALRCRPSHTQSPAREMTRSRRD
jgi:hypothetical protein